jgi:hypothetical protein
MYTTKRDGGIWQLQKHFKLKLAATYGSETLTKKSLYAADKLRQVKHRHTNNSYKIT